MKTLTVSKPKCYAKVSKNDRHMHIWFKNNFKVIFSRKKKADYLENWHVAFCDVGPTKYVQVIILGQLSLASLSNLLPNAFQPANI